LGPQRIHNDPDTTPFCDVQVVLEMQLDVHKLPIQLKRFEDVNAEPPYKGLRFCIPSRPIN
jgi:hypothetical protein